MISRETLQCGCGGFPRPQFDVKDSQLNQPAAVFVTLKKGPALRGCIGEMTARLPLWQAVREKTAAAAFSDPRFPAAEEGELKDISIEISVLSPLRKITDWKNIRLGTDGVMLKKGNRSGVYLPQVAQEHPFNLKTFLESLCRDKVGLPPDSYLDKDVEIFIFQCQCFAEKQ